MRQYDTDDLQYLAGYLDGEGTFYADDKYHKIRVSCTNTHKPTIEWLKETFGGSICQNATRLRSPNHRQCYSWQIVGREADNLCKAVVPYLKEKTPQALLCILIQQLKIKTWSGRYLPPEILEERRRLNSFLRSQKHVTWS